MYLSVFIYLQLLQNAIKWQVVKVNTIYFYTLENINTLSNTSTQDKMIMSYDKWKKRAKLLSHQKLNSV